MKSPSTLPFDIFIALAIFTTVISGMLIGADAITWNGSVDEDRYALCIIVSAIGGLLVGYARRPTFWRAILFGYIGLPIGIAISSAIDWAARGFSVNGILEGVFLAAVFYGLMPFMNLIFTWPFMISVTILRVIRRNVPY